MASLVGLDPGRDIRWSFSEHPTEHFGVPPAVLRFYTVAYCTPHCPWSSGSVWSKRRARSSLELGVLHAIRTPRVGTRFMACNLPARLETWRAFRIARHDNAP
jgi:hypothetical protein